MDNIIKEFEVLQKNLDNLPIENLADYDLSKTALFIVDINNGFAKEGALYSDRIKYVIGNNIHDYKAFVLTLKNPHKVEPTRFMKREESKNALLCTHLFGPCFGKMGLCVSYECNKSDNYVIRR